MNKLAFKNQKLIPNFLFVFFFVNVFVFKINYIRSIKTESSLYAILLNEKIAYLDSSLS